LDRRIDFDSWYEKAVEGNWSLRRLEEESGIKEKEWKKAFAEKGLEYPHKAYMSKLKGCARKMYFEEGKTIGEISAAIGKPREYVCYYLEIPPMRRRADNSERDEAICRKFKEGASVGDLAVAYDLSVSRIGQIVKKEKRRKRKKR
jgi:Mor family transcriptional regulator